MPARLRVRTRWQPGIDGRQGGQALFVPRPASASGAHERARRQLVRVVLVIYLLAIFEGSIRKWLLPQFSQYIFFIRDPFLLYAYLLAWRHGLWPRSSGWLQISGLMCGGGVLLLLLQIGIGGLDNLRLLLGAYGWRAYFFYVPLTFLIAAHFRPADLALFTRVTLLLALPIAALVAAQFFSPINSAINVGIGSDPDQQFRGLGLTGERTRPMGPFSSGAGQQQFVATAFALLVAMMITPRARRAVGPVSLLAAAAAILVCVGLSGSRGTLLQCVLSVVFALAVGLLARGAAVKAKAVLLPAALVVAAGVLYPIILPEGFAAFSNRWEHASQLESAHQGGLIGRALYGFIDFTRLVEVVPPLGYGLGYGGNASLTLKASIDGVMPGKLAETDYARHMVDLGPALGLCFIAFRLAFAIWLTRQVLLATRLSSDPLPMLLFSYAAYTVLLGQITGQGAINVYAWLFTGLCMASARCAFATLRKGRPRAAAAVQGPASLRLQELNS